MKLFRVIPYDELAAPHDRGGVLFIPGSTDGRVANPDLYRELYLAAQPEAAIAETFGRLAIWKPIDFIHATGRPYRLVTYSFPPDTLVLSLDNTSTLLDLGIIAPTDIVTRNRATSRAWARTVYLRGTYDGVSWWSFYNPDWTSLALSSLAHLAPSPTTPEVLTTTHPLVENAAKIIVRQIDRA